MADISKEELQKMIHDEIHSEPREHADPHADLRFKGKCPHCEENIGVCAGCKTIQKLDEDGKVIEED